MTKTNQTLPSDNNERYIAGDTATIEVTVTDDSGDGKDLEGANIVFAVSEYPSKEPVIRKTDSTNDIEVIAASKGRFNVNIGGNETENLGSADGEKYYYEIAIRDDSGKEVTVTTGEWKIYANTASF